MKKAPIDEQPLGECWNTAEEEEEEELDEDSAEYVYRKHASSAVWTWVDDVDEDNEREGDEQVDENDCDCNVDSGEDNIDCLYSQLRNLFPPEDLTITPISPTSPSSNIQLTLRTSYDSSLSATIQCTLSSSALSSVSLLFGPPTLSRLIECLPSSSISSLLPLITIIRDYLDSLAFHLYNSTLPGLNLMGKSQTKKPIPRQRHPQPSPSIPPPATVPRVKTRNAPRLRARPPNKNHRVRSPMMRQYRNASAMQIFHQCITQFPNFLLLDVAQATSHQVHLLRARLSMDRYIFVMGRNKIFRLVLRRLSLKDPILHEAYRRLSRRTGIIHYKCAFVFLLSTSSTFNIYDAAHEVNSLCAETTSRTSSLAVGRPSPVPIIVPEGTPYGLGYANDLRALVRNAGMHAGMTYEQVEQQLKAVSLRGPLSTVLESVCICDRGQVVTETIPFWVRMLQLTPIVKQIVLRWIVDDYFPIAPAVFFSADEGRVRRCVELAKENVAGIAITVPHVPSIVTVPYHMDQGVHDVLAVATELRYNTPSHRTRRTFALFTKSHRIGAISFIPTEVIWTIFELIMENQVQLHATSLEWEKIQRRAKQRRRLSPKVEAEVRKKYERLKAQMESMHGWKWETRHAEEDLGERPWRIRMRVLLIFGSVCRYWREVALDNEYWRKIFVEQWPRQNINLRMRSWYRTFVKRKKFVREIVYHPGVAGGEVVKVVPTKGKQYVCVENCEEEMCKGMWWKGREEDMVYACEVCQKKIISPKEREKARVKSSEVPVQQVYEFGDERKVYGVPKKWEVAEEEDEMFMDEEEEAGIAFLFNQF